MEKSIGALWIKEGKKGKFMTGKLQINGVEISVVAFIEKDKKNEKAPDVRIYLSKPRNQQTAFEEKHESLPF